MPLFRFAFFVVQPAQLRNGTCVFPSCSSQAFSFGKGNDIALEYLKELRQNGTDRRTEMSTLISGGFLEYQAVKEAEEAEVRKEGRIQRKRCKIQNCVVVCLLVVVGAYTLTPHLVLRMQKNKPPPSEEELKAQEKLFQEQREEEYAAIRAQNAIKRKEDDIKLVEVSTASAGSCSTAVDGRSQMPMQTSRDHGPV